MPIPTFLTERLQLRPFAPADAALVQALAGAPEVAATALTIPHPYPDGAAETWIARHMTDADDGIRLTWAIVRRRDETLLGAITLGLAGRHGRGSLGYWLGVPYWNQGYTTEAARRVTAFAFLECGCYRVEAGCFPRNVASSRVMEKSGLRYEGVLRSYLRKGDHFEDVAMYALLRPEFTG
jgi:RimJ/RimL family protein N-acetyltransferase